MFLQELHSNVIYRSAARFYRVVDTYGSGVENTIKIFRCEILVSSCFRFFSCDTCILNFLL